MKKNAKKEITSNVRMDMVLANVEAKKALEIFLDSPSRGMSFEQLTAKEEAFKAKIEETGKDLTTEERFLVNQLFTKWHSKVAF